MFQIELAKGTESEGLPEMLATLLRQNLEQKPYKLKDFNALDIVVGLKVTDLEVAMTLVFRHGHLVIRDGLVMDPKLLITTDSEGIFDLNLIRIRFGLPWYLDAQGRKVLKSLLSGRLKIRGMLTHMGSLTRLTKIMSVK
ncbi:MAG: hypothetical protein GTN74_09950 [Proteobacteria bacterium]|nr:hypothetical protein [Pseudomonadota bacterium]NIS70348.1 hypothetical protein [Pseudomonadota bacterium]